MPKALLANQVNREAISDRPAQPSEFPEREPVTITVRSSLPGVITIIQRLHKLGFADATEWSQPQPTGKGAEVIAVLSRYLMRSRGS
ncbi:MAG: hypothetical protein AAF152_17675 [Cyanobacteria bacterium P01_A01_bin.114]